MARLDGSGPEGKGSKTGRGLGRCSKANSSEKLEKLGVGMGKRRKADNCDSNGTRLKSGWPQNK